MSGGMGGTRLVLHPASLDEDTEARLRALGAAGDTPALSAACADARVDYAWIPDGRRLADFRLVAMDMDSTLITIECIDEIADLAGRKAEVSAITEAAMRGELDFPESLRRRVGALAGLPVSALDSVYAERLRLSPGAEVMLEAFRGVGIRTLLVSGGFSFFTSRLKQRLGLDYTLSNELEIADGKLTGRVLGGIVDGAAKAAALVSHREALGLSASQTVAIGDGANDLPMMGQAGVSIAFHAKPAVRAGATLRIDHGGLDAVPVLLGG